MPLSPERFAAAERWLLEKIAANRKVPELRDEFPEADADDGYRLSFSLIDRRLAAGERVIGYKAAVTAKPMQAFFDVHEPCAGVLTSGALITSGRVSVGGWVASNAEPEIAFVMGRALEGPGVTIPQVMAATESVMGALEIGNIRIGMEKCSMPTFIGLNTLNGGIVLGDRAVDPAAAGLDLRLEGMALEVDGRPAGSGTGVEALGDPRAVVAWIANLLARSQRRLEPGQVVITGSLVQGPIMKPGQHVRARFTHLGEVEVEFVE